MTDDPATDPFHIPPGYTEITIGAGESAPDPRPLTEAEELKLTELMMNLQEGEGWQERVFKDDHGLTTEEANQRSREKHKARMAIRTFVAACIVARDPERAK